MSADRLVLIVVRLRGGDSSESKGAVCVDLDPGLASERYDWSALVRPDRLDSLLHTTGATLVTQEAWDGQPFGDGNGGTVELIDGRVVGDGFNTSALGAS